MRKSRKTNPEECREQDLFEFHVSKFPFLYVSIYKR